MSVRDHLEAIREKHGYLDPAVVVAEATPKNHPLHEQLDWDNKTAGHAWRLHQAHRLIQVVRLDFVAGDGRPKNVRAYVAVPRAGSPSPVYEPTDEVMRDPVTRQIVLTQMEREWRTMMARYGDFTEFAELVQATLVGAG